MHYFPDELKTRSKVNWMLSLCSTCTKYCGFIWYLLLCLIYFIQSRNSTLVHTSCDAIKSVSAKILHKWPNLSGTCQRFFYSPWIRNPWSQDWAILRHCLAFMKWKTVCGWGTSEKRRGANQQTCYEGLHLPMNIPYSNAKDQLLRTNAR